MLEKNKNPTLRMWGINKEIIIIMIIIIKIIIILIIKIQIIIILIIIMIIIIIIIVIIIILVIPHILSVGFLFFSSTADSLLTLSSSLSPSLSPHSTQFNLA